MKATNLTDDEKTRIDDLTNRLIANTDANVNRAELFQRLSTLVAGVKLGLTIQKPVQSTV